MNRKISKMKPAVSKHVLLFLAGFMWFGVGTMLLVLSYSWLKTCSGHEAYLFGGLGVATALVIHHFGFLKIVDKNLGRILPMEGKRCVFSFIPWKSYLIIAVMIIMGSLLRNSRIPKLYLATLYSGIGLALVLSSMRYMKVLLEKLKKR